MHLECAVEQLAFEEQRALDAVPFALRYNRGRCAAAPTLGVKFTGQALENIRNAVKIRTQTPEWRANHALMCERRSQDPTWRKNCASAARRRAQDPMWLLDVAAQNKAKASDPEWRRKHMEGMRRHRGLPVMATAVSGETRFFAVQNDVNAAGFSSGAVSRVIRGVCRTHKGYTWRRATAEEIATHAGES